MMPVHADLHHLSEDDRIKVIGCSVMHVPASSADQPKITAFLVETEAKADRYVSKLQASFPGIRIIDRTPTLAHGTTMIVVRVGPPLR